MTATNDGAGRIVVAKDVREGMPLHTGAELEVKAEGDTLTLTPRRAGTYLIRKQGFLVHHGSEKSGLDLVEVMECERKARALKQRER